VEWSRGSAGGVQLAVKIELRSKGLTLHWQAIVVSSEPKNASNKMGTPGGRGEASTGSGGRQSVPMTITMTMTMDDSHGQRLAQSSPLIPVLSVWGTFNHVRTNITQGIQLVFSVQFPAAIYYLRRYYMNVFDSSGTPQSGR
jgi:hypothetical protein